MRLDLGGVLEQATEKFAARNGGAAVETKGEFVEAGVQMAVTDRALVGAHSQRLSSEKTRCTRGSTASVAFGGTRIGVGRCS